MRHPLKTFLATVAVFLFFPVTSLHALTWIEVAQLTHAGGAAHDNFGDSVAVDGDVAVVGDAKGGFNGVERAGVAHVFVRSGGTWTEAAELLPSDSAAGDLFGSVAIRGDTIAVGAVTIGIGAHDGVVYVFQRPAGGWSGTLNESARLDASGLGQRYLLGASVAFGGDSIVTTSKVLSNVLFVFNKPVSGWSGTVLPSGFLYCSLNGGYLAAVAGSGDVIVAGDPSEPIGNLQQAGKAFVWVKPGSGWSGFFGNAAELLPFDPIDTGEFGSAVAIDGTTVVVTNHYPNGSPSTPKFGKSYIFERPLTGWAGSLSENAQLVGSDVVNGDCFGCAASISGHTAVIGAPAGDSSQLNHSFGAAYVFDRPKSGWSGTVSETVEFTGPEGGTDSDFGYSVAISGGVIVVGAPREEVNGNVEQGAAHVFEARQLVITRIRFLVEGPIRVLPGVPVEFSVRVETLPAGQPGPAEPDGVVVIADDVGRECRAALDGAGEGSCELSFPSVGTYRVRAHYLGNAQFRDSTSPTLPVLVGNRSGG